MHITDLFIRNITPKDKPQTYWDNRLSGFGIRVNPGGTKMFIVLVASGRRKSLGRYPLLSLADARNEAKKMLAQKMLGKINPNSVPFDEAKDAFLEACSKKNKPATVKGYKQGLDAHFKFGRKSITDITEFQIRQILNKMDDKPSTKHHAFTTFRIFLNWCMSEGLLDRSPMAGMKPPTLPRSRDRVLTLEELTTIYTEVSNLDSPFYRIVNLLILTGARRGELAHLQWDWITEDDITFPWTVTKNKREHIIPQTAWTRQVLENCPSFDNCQYVFPASRTMSDKTTVFNGWGKPKAALDKKTGVTEWTLHDLRRTVATFLAGMGVEQIVVEKLLNHVSGGTQSPIAQVYNRYQYKDEMKDALVKWHTFLDTLLDPRHLSN